MAAMVFVYLMVRRAFPARVAAGALFAMALSPLLVRYAEEARMYGLVALIVAAATYVFLRMLEKPSKHLWIIYGVLVALGMWTHYFTLLMWLAHWVYRFIAVRRRSLRDTLIAFLSKDWVRAHLLAIALFVPWLPFMIKQMSNVQGGGFWIPPVTLKTPANFGADMFLYQLADDVKGWVAVLMWLLVIGLIALGATTLRRLTRPQRDIVRLLGVMALVPAVLLVALSLPPLRPAFIDRYLIAGIFCLFALIGVFIAVGLNAKKTRAFAAAVGILFVGIVTAGITQVYATGNYNIVTKDPLPIRPTLRLAQGQAAADEPFVVNSVWRFYEAHYYQTDRNPVYLQAEDSLTWGSYDMVRKNPYRKVYNVAEFAKQHGGKIMYVGDWKHGSPKLPPGEWTVLREVHADGISDDTSTIRVVELQLK